MPMPKDFCHAAYELADEGCRRDVERAARLMRDAAKSEEAADDPA